MKKKYLIPISVISVILIAITLFTVSCDKKEIIDTILPTNESKVSLAEFIKSAKSDEEISFFKNHKIIDNTTICEKVLKNISKTRSELNKAKFSFTWPASDCEKPLGICIILTFLGDEIANTSVAVVDGKYIVIPSTEDNGLTTDGYLPVLRDLYVDENTTVKAGIYTANYDEAQGKYTAIALDLK